MGQYQKIIKVQEDNERISHHLSTERHTALMTGAKQVVNDFLTEQGITPTNGEYIHTAPALRALPTDMENVTDWRCLPITQHWIPSPTSRPPIIFTCLFSGPITTELQRQRRRRMDRSRDHHPYQSHHP